ncbi:hypothetical protein [Chitinophaga japonensis]|uniref:Outer membrane lipoprotein-sorting protein n=1 Tax=Chitinophaga japonensis TaxID=104662 RepID=A0A562SYZ8_CHIJA|nr:hypothetical protein [Chitinophaga japonensis]TWI86254.1 hypothetical protein LX66_3506 [Chitinophaga japonensis]
MRVLLLCLLHVTGLFAQDRSWEQLQHLCETYARQRTMAFQTRLKMYTAQQPVKVLDELQAVCRVNGRRFYAQIGPVEIVKNSHCQLTIDHDEKIMVVAPADTAAQQGDMTTTLMDMGKLLQDMKEWGVKARQVLRGNDTWLELTGLPDPAMQQCNIQYDPQTFLIKRVWMKAMDETVNAEEAVIVDIAYSDYRLSTPEATWFNEGRFVRMNGKQAVLQPSWQQYTLINQL